MTSADEFTKEVIKKLNDDHGKDLFTLENCIRIKNLFNTRIKEIKSELDLRNSNSTIATTVVNATQSIEHINNVIEEVESCTEKVDKHLQEAQEIKTALEKHFIRLNVLECTQQYVKVLQCVESLCNELQMQLEKGDDEQCTTAFANITEIARHLSNIPAIHLRNYLRKTVDYWYNILKNKFSQDFDEVLKAIKWPFVNVNFGIEIPSETNIKKLQTIVEYLLQIDLPEELIEPSHIHGLFSGFPHLSLPIELLLAPLKKRFLFHFYGSRKTNRVDKPEWYFTKILSWIRDHSDFADKWIQPVVDKMGLYHIEVKIDLMRGLVQLAIEKLFNDLPNLQNNDFIFSHCIDEALGFDKELKVSYDYPASQPSIFIVLTQAQIFIKWLSMEKKYALEKMDVMLSESIQDEILIQSSEMEECKIMPSGEVFVTLLQTITERYEALPQPGHRLQFLELQLELLDDFRVRLVQLVSAEDGDVVNSKIAVIANTAYYIENVLVDWGQMLHFLNLYYYKNQFQMAESIHAVNSEGDHNSLTDIDTDTVFAHILSLYRHMKKDLLFTLVDSIIGKAKYGSKKYRHENWSNMEKMKDMRSHSLTPSACPIFEILATKLHQLQKHLTSRLFTIVWRLVAQQMDTFLYEKLVLINRFNEGGGQQFKFDITRNLFPLFAQYTDKPGSYCINLNESCALLTLAKGSAILLRETLISLEGATGVEDRRGQALKEIGVHTLKPQEALNILNQRTDIKMHRMSSID